MKLARFKGGFCLPRRVSCLFSRVFGIGLLFAWSISCDVIMRGFGLETIPSSFACWGGIPDGSRRNSEHTVLPVFFFALFMRIRTSFSRRSVAPAGQLLRTQK